jgi:hypothetical protein
MHAPAHRPMVKKFSVDRYSTTPPSVKPELRYKSNKSAVERSLQSPDVPEAGVTQTVATLTNFIEKITIKIIFNILLSSLSLFKILNSKILKYLNNFDYQKHFIFDII